MTKKYYGLKGRKITMFFVLIALMIIVFVAGALIIAQITDKEVRDSVSNTWAGIIGFATSGGLILINAIAQHNPQIPESDDPEAKEDK